MNIMIIIGLVLGAGTMVTDRFIRRIPSKVAVVLYAAAAILIIVGMVAGRTAAA